MCICAMPLCDVQDHYPNNGKRPEFQRTSSDEQAGEEDAEHEMLVEAESEEEAVPEDDELPPLRPKLQPLSQALPASPAPL